MVDLNVNPKQKAPEIPGWVKWAATAAVGTIVSWHVSRALEKHAALKASTDAAYPSLPPPNRP